MLFLLMVYGPGAVVVDTKLQFPGRGTARIRPVALFFDKPGFFFDERKSCIGRIFAGIGLNVGRGAGNPGYVCTIKSIHTFV